MSEVKKLLEQKVSLQNDILCRYGKATMDLVDNAVVNDILLLDLVSDVGGGSLELFKEYQRVCNVLQSEIYSEEVELCHRSAFSGRCQDCGEDVILCATV